MSTERWTEEAVAALGPDEYDFQEFKGAGWLWLDGAVNPEFHVALSKQLSAFGNGAGGRIVIGVDDAGQIDGGVPVDARRGGTRAWLEDVAATLTDPPLGRFNVYEVLGVGPETRIKPGHAVYVLEVHPSDAAPHQALDHRYYLRIAGKSRPMGHVHVQDVLRRTRHPAVHVKRLAPYGPDERLTDDPRGPKALVALRIYLENRGRRLARHVGLEVVLPRPLVNREVRKRTLEAGDARLTQRPGHVHFFRYHDQPLFPSQDVCFFTFWVALHGGNRDAVVNGTADVAWRIYADDAPAREGRQRLDDFAVVREALDWLQRQRPA
jgi:hypothetical protein